jgi:YVTN family beta-propeller protein
MRLQRVAHREGGAHASSGSRRDASGHWLVPRKLLLLAVGCMVVAGTAAAVLPTASAAPAPGTPAAENEVVLVANGGSGTVTDTGPTWNLTLKVGNGPAAIAVTPNGQYAYVANQGSGTVSVISGANGSSASVAATLTVGGAPSGVAVTPDGQYAYVANAASDDVSVISAASAGSPAVTGTIAEGGESDAVAVTPNGQYLYVADTTYGEVSVYSGASTGSYQNIGDLQPEAGTPESIAFSPDGQYAYMAFQGGTEADGIVAASGAQSGSPELFYTATVNVSAGVSMQVAVTPDGNYAYAAGVGGVYVVNVFSVDGTPVGLTLDDTLTAGASPAGVAFSPDGQYAYFPDKENNDVDIASSAESGSPAVLTRLNS